MALLLIGLRLSLPWLFTAFLKPWLTAGQSAAWEQTGPVFLFAAALALGMSLMGFADHRERLWFGRFAIQTVNDMRRAALATTTERFAEPESNGDLLSRLIGDATRIKNGMHGFLVHVATNGALCCGVTLVMLFMNPVFGVVFSAALLAMATAAFIGATRVYAESVKHREAEGRMANKLQQDDLAEAFSRFSGEKETRVNQIQGRTTWIVHTLFGLVLFATVLVGMHEKRAGRLTGSEVVVITIYAWMLRAPVVQLARQAARTGKIVACIERFGELFEAEDTTASLERLDNSIRLEGVRIKSDRETGRRRRLAIEALEFQIGQPVAVLGKPGAGKTTLLTLLAQRPNTAFVPHDARWLRQPLGNYLGLDAAREPLAAGALRASRARYVVERLPGGLSAVVGSHDLSSYERQAVALARGLLSEAQVLLLDDPIRGLSDERATKMLTQILALEARRTLIVALSRPAALDLFERVIYLKKGRVTFDGTPRQWAERMEARRVLRDGLTGAAPPNQAVILAAGCGRRYGAGLPKTLLPIGGRTLLEHQIEMLRRHGIERICVVVGHGAERVRGVGGTRCDYIENSRPETTNSLYSLWLARDWVTGPFVLLNADVLAHSEIYRRVVSADGTALAYDSTSGKDDEHMKVRLHSERLEKIAKDLPRSDAHGENVGLLKFTGAAVPVLFEEVERLIAGGGEVLSSPAAVDLLAGKFAVRCIDIAGLPWAEIDFPEDLRAAEERVWPLIA